MSSIVDISVQHTTDPNVKVYNTRVELTGKPEVGFRGCADEVGAFANLVLEIDGVTQVQLGSYVLIVTKAPLYSWDEVQPKVRGLLETFVISQRQLAAAYAETTITKEPGIAGHVPSSSRVTRKTKIAG